jgi:hypothetical protein
MENTAHQKKQKINYRKKKEKEGGVLQNTKEQTYEMVHTFSMRDR